MFSWGRAAKKDEGLLSGEAETVVDSKPSPPQPPSFSSAPQPQPTNTDHKNAPFWSLQHWSFLFNVDTLQVGHRILKSIVPFPVNFFEITKENPDLYGPFWVASTLIFILAATGNVASFFVAVKEGTTTVWSYNLEILGIAAGVVYGFLIVFPLAFWGLFRWWGIGLDFLHVICIYGYSLFSYIPVSIICVVPYKLVRIIAIGVAGLLSTVLIITNFWKALHEHRKKSLLIIPLMAIIHVAFAAGCLVYFVLLNFSSVQITN